MIHDATTSSSAVIRFCGHELFIFYTSKAPIILKVGIHINDFSDEEHNLSTVKFSTVS
jgi:hypothetical protein